MRKAIFITAILASFLPQRGASANGFQRHDTISGMPMPYDFPHRNAATSGSIQEKRRSGCGCGSGGAGGAGGVTYSYAIGNWSQIDMTLGANANGMINSEEHQNNWGNETATMNIDSQNALGDQVVNNGADWSGRIEDQVIGNSNTVGGSNP